MSPVPLLPEHPPQFPDPASALDEPNGLVAAGGALTPSWLLTAYSAGIFPWFNDDDSPILWWSPDPRAVLLPGGLRISRSLRKTLRRRDFTVTADRAFADVVDACAAPRVGASGTWITPAMEQAYRELHELGFAHSVEVWHADELVGGLYGLSLGRMFFGESMFSRRPDASKVALAHLVAQLRRWHFNLIDCQLMNPHLESLGAQEMARSQFLALLAANADHATLQGRWHLDDDLDPLELVAAEQS